MIDISEYCEDINLNIDLDTNNATSMLLSTLYGSKVCDSQIVHETAVVSDDCYLGENVFIGPYSFIRGGSYIDNGAVIGHACEIARCYIGKNTRVTHKATMADAIVGANVNIGALVSLSPYNLFEIQNIVFENECIEKKILMIGDQVVVGANCTLGPNILVGKQVIIYPNNVIGNIKIPNKIVVKTPHYFESRR